MFRAFRVVFGYILLLIGGVSWFVCFPLTAYTFYVARELPFTYFNVPTPLPFPIDAFMPKEMAPALVMVCLAFTLYGMFVIYFDVRKLRRLRRGEK